SRVTLSSSRAPPPDPHTLSLHDALPIWQQVRLRATRVRQRTRLKNQVHAVLHQQGLRSPATDLFGKRGRLWLKDVKLPQQARESDRKSTRLNSSHQIISYAVFCVKKQND